MLLSPTQLRNVWVNVMVLLNFLELEHEGMFWEYWRTPTSVCFIENGTWTMSHKGGLQSFVFHCQARSFQPWDSLCKFVKGGGTPGKKTTCDVLNVGDVVFWFSWHTHWGKIMMGHVTVWCVDNIAFECHLKNVMVLVHNYKLSQAFIISFAWIKCNKIQYLSSCETVD